jgi:group I intron endonuclease
VGGIYKLIIYKATNLINGKIYIGQTINTLEHRKNQHFREARSKRRKTVYFHNALNKYGYDNFEFEEIDWANTQEELNEKERYWVKYYNSNNKNKGYNLDSGGQSGGVKSEETKRKIGKTTKEKWNNPETAEKMKQGLLKGVETMKRNAKTYPFTCPICNKTFYYPKYIADSKKFCSNECARKGINWQKGVYESARLNHEKNIERKKIIKNHIVDWVLHNEKIVLNCPYNKITANLTGLVDMLTEKYNIKDLRTIYICFDVKNLKELLDKLKEIIYISKENVC